VADLVYAMLAKAPAERPSMDAVVQLLERLRTALPAVWSVPLRGEAATLPEREALAYSNTAAEVPTGPGRADSLAMGVTVPGSATASGRLSKDSMQPLLKAAITADPSVSRSSQGGATPLPVAQVSALSAAPRPRPAWLGIAAVAVLAVGVGGLALLRGGSHPGRPVTAGVTAPGGPVSAPVRRVRWTVSSVPDAAEVVRADGLVLGSTPWELERQAETGETVLTLRHPGYKDKSIVLGHNTDVKTEIHLEAVTPPPAAGPAASEPAAAEKGSPAGKKRRNRSAAKDSGDKAKGTGDKDVELLE
jgi:hypothetical protein